VGQRVVQGTGLGLRSTGRDHQNLKPAGSTYCQGFGDRVLVMPLKHQQALEAVSWIVDPGQAFDQLADYRGLVVKGRENGVTWPVLGERRVRQRRGTGHNQDDTPDRYCEKGAGRQDHQPARHTVLPDPQGEHKTRAERCEQQGLEGGEPLQRSALFKRRAASRGVAPTMIRSGEYNPLHHQGLTWRFALCKRLALVRECRY